MKNKFLARLDIKSQYINVPIDRLIERLENHLRKTNTILPLNLLKSVPFLHDIVISNTTARFKDRNLVWVHHLILSLFALMVNSLNLVLLEILSPAMHVTSNTLMTFHLFVY